MVLETTLRPSRPYSLALSARAAGDATRVFRDGVLTLVFESDGAPALARVRQRPDGTLAVRVESSRAEGALERLRFVLACDDDLEPFYRLFAGDRLLGEAIRRLRGLRPLRSATVAHALLKAVCGQLVQAREAKRIEARLLLLASPEHGGLRLPPTRTTFARFSPAELARHGLVLRKSTTLVRLSRELELERLHGVPTEAAAARIERERGLGPWSAGVICLKGLGRYERGLVGDLGLIKLAAALRGRRATAEDTRDLLEPYSEWAGLASVYLLAGPARPSRARAAPGTGSRPGSSRGR